MASRRGTSSQQQRSPIAADLDAVEEVVRRQKRLGLEAVRDRGDGAVVTALADARAAAFREQKVTLSRERDAVGAVGVLAYNGDLAGRVEMEDAADPDIGEIEAAVRRADGPFWHNWAIAPML